MDAEASPGSASAREPGDQPFAGPAAVGAEIVARRMIIAEPWDEIGYWTTSQPDGW